MGQIIHMGWDITLWGGLTSLVEPVRHRPGCLFAVHGPLLAASGVRWPGWHHLGPALGNTLAEEVTVDHSGVFSLSGTLSQKVLCWCGVWYQDQRKVEAGRETRFPDDVQGRFALQRSCLECGMLGARDFDVGVRWGSDLYSGFGVRGQAPGLGPGCGTRRWNLLVQVDSHPAVAGSAGLILACLVEL